MIGRCLPNTVFLVVVLLSGFLQFSVGLAQSERTELSGAQRRLLEQARERYRQSQEIARQWKGDECRVNFLAMAAVFAKIESGLSEAGNPEFDEYVNQAASAAVRTLAISECLDLVSAKVALESLRSAASAFFACPTANPHSRASTLIGVCLVLRDDTVWREGLDQLANGLPLVSLERALELVAAADPRRQGDTELQRWCTPAGMLEAVAHEEFTYSQKFDAAALLVADAHSIALAESEVRHIQKNLSQVRARLAEEIAILVLAGEAFFDAGELDLSDEGCRYLRGEELGKDLCSWLTGWPRICVEIDQGMSLVAIECR